MPLQQNLDMLAGRIAELLAQSETLGEAGDIDGAQAAIAQVETLKVGHRRELNRSDEGKFLPLCRGAGGSPFGRLQTTTAF